MKALSCSQNMPWTVGAGRSALNPGLFDNDKKLSKYTEEEMELLLYSEPIRSRPKLQERLQPDLRRHRQKFTNKYIKRDLKTMSERTQKSVEPYMTMVRARYAKARGLSQAVLKCKINGHNIAELTAMEVRELIEVIQTIQRSGRRADGQHVDERLQHLVDIGLEYLSLNRETTRYQAANRSA